MVDYANGVGPVSGGKGTKKNGSGLKRGAYLHMAVRFLGLGLREALLLPVGLVFDLMDLESRRISGKTKN